MQLNCTSFESYLEACVCTFSAGIAGGWVLSATSDDGRELLTAAKPVNLKFIDTIWLIFIADGYMLFSRFICYQGFSDGSCPELRGKVILDEKLVTYSTENQHLRSPKPKTLKFESKVTVQL